MTKESGTRRGRLLKRIFNVRTWSDWDRMRTFVVYIKESAMRLFVLQPKKEGDPFDVVVARLHLTEEALLIKKKSLLRLSFTMVFMATLLFFYFIYQLISGHVMGFILTFIVMLIALVLAFRYHFWYFQIRERKLGCTFREWFHRGLMGGRQ